MLEVDALRKSYGSVVAVDGVSLRAEAGEILGLLGPNGAGKSTTIHCISGLLRPGSGHVRVMGHDVIAESMAARAVMGIVPQELALYEDLSATGNLRFWGQAWGLRGEALGARVDEVLEQVGLLDRASEPVRGFSGGMKRRLNFACGIVHQPKLLLLDEPTVAVDPHSRMKLIELVRAQVAAGTCVLYTTHQMDEAQELCDRIAIIDHGTIIAQGTLDELRGIIGERDLLQLTGTFDTDAAATALADLTDAGSLEVVSAAGSQLLLASPQASRLLPDIFAALTGAGAEIRETTLKRPSLESLFLTLTGKELRE